MIPEPQRTYILELLKALGPAADDFVVAGAQAMKFFLERARATKDIDFVLDVVGLRGEELSIGAKLQDLGYMAWKALGTFNSKSRYLIAQRIRGSSSWHRKSSGARRTFASMWIRVSMRGLVPGSIAIAESALHAISGRLPDGSPFETSIRVTKPHALVMLKLLALDDRYRNIRGLAEARHDREEARTHAADIVAISFELIRVYLDTHVIFNSSFRRMLNWGCVSSRSWVRIFVRPLHRALSCTKSSSWRISRLTVMLAGRSVKRSRERTS